MRYRGIRLLLFGVTALMSVGLSRAATVTHSTITDFTGGTSDAVVQPVYITFGGGTVSPDWGAVGAVPTAGTSLLNEDFNYTSQAAAEAAGWLLRTPNADSIPELVANPSTFAFNNPTGTLRFHVSRPQDLWGTQDAGGRMPMLAMHDTPVTGDFVAETRFTVEQPRLFDNRRSHGIFITQARDEINGKVTDLPIDDQTLYLAAASSQEHGIASWSRLQTTGPWLVVTDSFGFPTQTMWVRVVKIGEFFHTYMKTAENAPWIYEHTFHIEGLAGGQNAPVIVGLFSKSWGGVSDTASQYEDVTFDYFRLNRVGTTAGAYTNVFDAGQSADWRTVSLTTQSMQGLKFQLRAGNTLAGGTLTDAGAFIGPDGTGASYFEDDAAQVVPNGSGKRYLEYRILLDALVPTYPGQTAANLQPVVESISAVFEPAALQSVIASNQAQFGPDSTVATQLGGGDLSLARTQTFRDDFNTDPLTNGWTLDEGWEVIDPAATGDVTVTERPGYARLKVGYPQDIFAGDNEIGGVKLLRDAPAGDFEIEALLNVESTNNRLPGIALWQDANNYVLLGAGRLYGGIHEIGVLDEVILNDAANVIPPTTAIRSYGTNNIYLRLTKVGARVTLSFRSAESPSWRVLRVLDTTGRASGGTDFAPTKVGLFGKSFGEATRTALYQDYDYFTVSSLPTSGSKDVPFTLPAGNRLDTILATGDAISGANTRFQVRNGSGAFIGPDNTSASFFTANEPKVPSGLAGLTSTDVRVLMDANTPSGVPYLHTVGLQYVTGSTAVARDTNRTDFAAGTVLNGIDVNSTPGVLIPTIGTGAPVTTDFNAAPSGWLFSNTPSGNSSYSFTESAGNARLNMGWPEDLWEGPADPTAKPRIFLYKDTPITGDYEIETLVNMPQGRQLDRHFGIAVVQSRAAGTPPNTNLDLTNLVMWGLFHPDLIHFMVADNNRFYDNVGVGGQTGNSYYLRIRKVGATFTGYYKVNEGDPWIEGGTITNPNINSAYVGFLGKSWGGLHNPAVLPADFDYLKVTPLTTTGTYESRALDLGAAGLTPILSTQGGNLGAVQIQVRAADTVAGLASQPYVGPDATAATTFAGTFSGALPTSLSGKRYLQYRAILPAGTTLNDVTLLGVTGVTLPFTRGDVLAALRIAGGLEAATTTAKARYDVVAGSSAGRVDLLDAVQIARTAQ